MQANRTDQLNTPRAERANRRRIGGRAARYAVAAVTLAALTAPRPAAAKDIGTVAITSLTTPVGISHVSYDVTPRAGGSGGIPVIRIIKAVDAASPDLAYAVLSGTHYPSAQIVSIGKGGSTATYDLDDVTIASVGVGPDAKGQVTETVSFSFKTITITVDGVSRCWDLAANRAC